MIYEIIAAVVDVFCYCWSWCCLLIVYVLLILLLLLFFFIKVIAASGVFVTATIEVGVIFSYYCCFSSRANIGVSLSQWIAFHFSFLVALRWSWC